MTLGKIIIIVGPTAAGKTKLSLLLAKKLGGEIVSADSRQIYRTMDIGTAKPSKANLALVPHHLIDVIKPTEQYSVAKFKNHAISAINKIIRQRKIPILVGGTGLYIRSIIENLTLPRVKANPRLRAKLQKELKEKGLYYLFGKLTVLDPEASHQIDSKNPRRVIRALEVAMTTGKPFTAQREKGPKLYDFLILGLKPPRHVLKQMIFLRVEKMLKAGLLNEVTKLTKKYGFDPPAFDAIGYREIVSYIKGEITWPGAKKLIQQNTWRFSRQQMNWFNSMPVVWIKSQKQAENEIKNFLR